MANELRYEYSRHKSAGDAAEALEAMWAEGLVGPGERPLVTRVKAHKGKGWRWAITLCDWIPF